MNIEAADAVKKDIARLARATFRPEVLAGLMIFSGEEADRVLRKYREFIAAVPDELSIWAILRAALTSNSCR